MDIVEELRNDRERGARRLESEYRAGLMTLARRFCADEGDAEELVNRTFAAVVEGIDDYIEQSAFFAWMCRILSNIHAKDGRRKMGSAVVADPAAVDAAEDPAAEQRIFREVDAGLLRDAVQELPPDIRNTLLLHYFMDIPVREVARVLSVPSGTVKWRLHYARMILGAKLAAQRPGVRMLFFALLLAAGLAAGRGVYKLASAVFPPHAESAEVVSRAEASVSTISTASPVSTVSTASPVSTASNPEPSAMHTRSLLAATASLALAASPSAGATVDSTDFGKMIPITVSGYAGSTTLEHFPALVRLSTAITGFDYADVGTTAAAAAADLRFADAAGNSLDYEIDTWDPDGTSLVWVSVPAISGNTTRLFAYYKADAAATLPAVDPTAVWSSAGYVGVWHMNAVDATDGSVADSSGNGFSATPKATSATPTLVTDGAGPFGAYVKGTTGGGLFLPANALVPYNADADDKMQSHYSAEAWLNRNGDSSNKIILSTGEGWNTGAQVGLQGYLYGNAHHNSNNNKIPGTAGVWSLVAATWSASGDAAHLFCGSASLNDGKGQFLLEGLNRTDTNSDFTQFSLNSYANRSGNGNESFAGFMDEFRLRRVASSKDWVQAVYDNGKAGSTFLAPEAVVSLDAGVVGNVGAASGVTCTTATITGLFAAADPTAYSATYTLTAGGAAVRTDVAAGTLARDGSVAVALDDLVPGTDYAFVFTVVVGDASVYSAGSFTTAALPVPAVSGVGDHGATASLAATLTGAAYAAGTVTAVFAPVAGGTEVRAAAAFADGAWTAATTALEADQDYTVRFEIEPSGAAAFASPASAAFATTGRATVSNTDFRYVMRITVSGYDGEETLANFPALVRVPAAVAELVDDPAGIRFALADRTLLPHEIERWDPDGISTIWVSIPSLAGKDTSFEMLWRPVVATVHGAPAPARVWANAGYVGVWHFAAQNADGSYPDASGHGATAVPTISAVPAAPVTDGTSANGSPWHVVNVGVKVAPENAADWTFSATGYTTETWLIPTANYNRMFCYENSNNGGNAMAFGKTEVYAMRNNYYKTDWTTGELTADATWNKTWRFATTVWTAPDCGWTFRFYENGTQKCDWGQYNAVDFTANGMGLTTGTRGNGSVNYSVDELRVRRGNSTADWVQANYDTQVPGSDFLTCGKPSCTQRATLILVK